MAQVSDQKCSLCDENNGAYYCYECQHALCTVCRKRNDIIDVVIEERQKAKENIEKLKLKTETLSSLQEKIRREHIENLHVESKTCIGHIESVSKNLQEYITAKGSIKTSEVEDNKTTENQKFEAFLKNTDLIQKRYVHILSELENLLLEKHDITFYSGYRSLQSDIQTLVSIPAEPLFAKVPIFEDEFLFKEVMYYMESKMKKSLCPICPIQKKEIEDLQAKYNICKETSQSLNQKCSVQKKQIEDLQSEYNICKKTFHRDLEAKDDEIPKLSEDIKSLKREKNTMQSTYVTTCVTNFINVEALKGIL
ncbi:unnamed protein product [Mytilus coruscus]|uniref:B box-type domain-containing protein n=1 Tax=Mytilus coruscus TaxID=42192 RepID=A0A6J8BV31_MYTCO|nr:unnamed protein product [Mytilus coruscus]